MSQPKTFPAIQGRCPACRGASLFLGNGGHVTCSRLDCPNPSAADQLLHASSPDAPLRDQLQAAIKALGASETELAQLRSQPAPAATERETTTRVFAALHRSAEQDVSRVITLYEQWVTAGPPPLGTPMARWWDKRLVELHHAILPPAPAATEATEHHYLSTGCLHGDHGYCQGMTGLNGSKRPGECKFCRAPCQCSCHQTRP